MSTPPPTNTGNTLGGYNPHAFDDTLGSLFIGIIVSTMVFGILVSQVYTYYRVFPSDKVSYKMIVAVLLLLQVVIQAFVSHAYYYFGITLYSNSIQFLLGTVPITLLIQTPLGALSGTIVKICFAVRVWRFSGRNWVITTIIIILALVQLGFSILYTYNTFLTPHLYDLADLKLQRLATISLGTGAFTDVLTAVTLCWCLQKYKTGQRQSDSLVHSLSIYAVNTGVVTSAFSLATLLIYNRMPNNFIFLGVYFVLSHLYAISFVATLNSRRSVKADGVLGTTEQFNLVYPAIRPPNNENMLDLGEMTMKSFESPMLDGEREIKHPDHMGHYREDW
jgi:hypothetical protein